MADFERLLAFPQAGDENHRVFAQNSPDVLTIGNVRVAGIKPCDPVERRHLQKVLGHGWLNGG